MEIKLFPLHALPAPYWPAWEKIRHLNSDLASPFFHPEFAKIVASVREDAEVGVLLQDGGPVGFFPFQRGCLGIGRPLGGHFSDFQAVIALPQTQWTPTELMRGCRLAGWDFDHVLASMESFAPFAQWRLDSPVIDLPDGFRGYEENRKANGSRVVKHVVALARKLEREVGPLRFAYHCPDPGLFQQMLTWKRNQFKKTGVGDVFAKSWTVALLTKILDTQAADFGGVLSALWARDRLVAVHMGMRSRSVWHYWFPTYDPEFFRYSPGMLLILEMMKIAEAHDLKKIDLGKGDADYKTRLMTGATPVLEGSIIISPSVRWARAGWRAARACLRGTPLRSGMRKSVSSVRSWLQKRGSS